MYVSVKPKALKRCNFASMKTEKASFVSGE